LGCDSSSGKRADGSPGSSDAKDSGGYGDLTADAKVGLDLGTEAVDALAESALDAPASDAPDTALDLAAPMDAVWRPALSVSAC
jgi:hypothetical protein